MLVIDHFPAKLNHKVCTQILPTVQQFVSKSLVESICREAGHSWRDRFWSPLLTLLACIHKQLFDVSVRQLDDWLASLGAPPRASGSRDGHAFCMARRRLPLEVFARVLWRLGTLASNAGAWVWKDKRILLIDGTTLRAPRTPSNLKAFGQSDNGHKKSHFPLVRLVALICAGSGAVCDLVLGEYACSEMRAVRRLLERLQSGALLVVDAGFSSFMFFWLTRQRGCDVLARHHQTRQGKRLKRLGDGDELHAWQRPKKPRVTWADLLALTPRNMQVRVITCLVLRKGYRDLVLKICTTLLDPQAYPAQELVVLYLQRWHVEVDFRTIKCDFGMGRLSGQSADVVMKEIYATLIAYNAVRQLMALSGTMPRQISITRARALLRDFSTRMAAAPTIRLPQLYAQLLHLIATTTLTPQERPPNPRRIVVRPSTYRTLTTSRQQWLKDYNAA